MSRLEKTINKQLVEAYDRELQARGITDNTKHELVTAARPMFKKRARAMANGVRAAARQRAKAFKAGELPPVTVPALPGARTVALRQEPFHVREAVREEDVPYVGDWGY